MIRRYFKQKMAGFGNLRNGKKKKRKKEDVRQPTGEAFFKSAIAYHKVGDLTNAEKA